MIRAACVAAIAVAASVCHPEEHDPMPWKTNTPIVEVRKDLYEKPPRPQAAACGTVRYVRPAGERSPN